MLKRLLRRPAAQAAIAAVVGRYLAFALRTTAWTVHGIEHVGAEPLIVAFWHERLPLMAALWTRARQMGTRQMGTRQMGTRQTDMRQTDMRQTGTDRTGMHQPRPMRASALVSRHSDGRLIGLLMRRFDVDIVHGSTRRDGRDRGGAAGLRALLGVIRDGGHVILTPDGPRGPRRVAAPGVAQIAALSGASVLPCAAQTRRRRVLATWDRMVVPLPWGRGVIVCAPPVAVAREGWAAALPAISAAMSEAADAADRLCT